MEYYTIRLPNTVKTLAENYEVRFSARKFECGLLEVTRRSPVRLKRYVEKIARYFMRESEYDFVQFCADEDEHESDEYSAWLYIAQAGEAWLPGTMIFGATCFRLRNYADRKSPWGMQWVWLHPYFREHGVLSTVWPFFRERFGDFFPEPPLSRAMSAFLKKMDTAKQRYAPNAFQRASHED